MSALKNIEKRFVRFFLVAVLFLVFLVPATGMAARDYIEFTGTLLSSEQHNGPNVITLRRGDQKWYLGVADVNTGSFFANNDSYVQDDWGMLRRYTISDLRLIGNSKKFEPLNENKTCDPLKISGFISYDSKMLTVTNVEPLPMGRDYKLVAWCKR